MLPDFEKFKRLREERAWTQEMLSKKSGVPLRTIQRLEAGHNVRLSTLSDLAGTFKVPLEELLRRPKSAQQQAPQILPRLTNGTELARVIGGSEAHQFDHDHLETQDEVDMVGGFLQDLHDWGNLWSELEPSERVNATFSLTEALQKLEEAGFWVFGLSTKGLFRINALGEPRSIRLTVALVKISRSSSPDVMKLGPNELLHVRIDAEQLRQAPPSAEAAQLPELWRALIAGNPSLKKSFEQEEFAPGTLGAFLRSHPQFAPPS